MKKKYKIYISIIAIYAIIALIVLIFNIYNNHNSGYIILPGENVYYKDNNSITAYSNDIDKAIDIKFITDYGTNKLKFKLINNNVELYNNDTLVEFDENFKIAYSSNLKLNLADYSSDELNSEDMKKVSDILKEHGIIGYENLNTSSKVSFDYNNDGISETIYFVSNLFDETKYDKVFSFVYYISGNDIIYLIEQIDTIENTYELCIPSMNSIVDLNNDGIYEFIISCEYFSNIGIDNQIYEQKENLFNLINK